MSRYLSLRRIGPSGSTELLPMRFASWHDTGNGFPGIVGTAEFRGAVYELLLSAHDLQWALSEVEREIDLKRAREAFG